ncbi:MAG: hypothetical protein OIF32_09915 [Campylobacterales bacterium]|nr:hypothetical protein [Campylobacterales bacterium]
MQIKKVVIFFIFSIFLASCSLNKPIVSNSYLVVLKTQKIKFADSGFLDIWENSAKISAYFAGKSLLNLEFGSSFVCIDYGCITKSEFNKDFLNESYYDNLFLDVVQKKTLDLDGEVVNKEFGFVQKIKNEKFDIVYRVSKDETFFRDRQNNIIIKFKEL